MTEADRAHWNSRYASAGRAPAGDVGPPPVFQLYEHLFPSEGTALEVACGRGRGGIWLASRGLSVWGLDVSDVAIEHARQLANESGLADRCRFDVVDLDDGLPPGPEVDLVMCHMFRDPRLDQPILQRLRRGGLLAVAVSSEVDAGPGPFRAKPGELRSAFGHLDVLADGEREGRAWLLARQ